MIVFIIYVWIFDLFLYSNTEIFLVFFIFLNFGFLVFNIITWYYEYLDEWILSENRMLYTTVFALRKKFGSVKNHILLLDNKSASFNTLGPNYFGFSFPAILATVNLAIIRYHCLVQHRCIVQYLNNILFQMYQFEINKRRLNLLVEFKNLNFDVFDLPVSVYHPDFATYLFANSVFNVLLADFKFFNCSEDFFSHWVSNFPFHNYIEIYLEG